MILLTMDYNNTINLGMYYIIKTHSLTNSIICRPDHVRSQIAILKNDQTYQLRIIVYLLTLIDEHNEEILKHFGFSGQHA